MTYRYLMDLAAGKLKGRLKYKGEEVWVKDQNGEWKNLGNVRPGESLWEYHVPSTKIKGKEMATREAATRCMLVWLAEARKKSEAS